MKYLISRNNIPSQFIHLELSLSCHEGEKVQLQIPSWRPGRYELANYAQKIKNVHGRTEDEDIVIHKLTKDLWQFNARKSGIHIIQYDFHASQMDAGGSWSDDEQLYLNFINFIFQVKGRENESIQVHLDLPNQYRIATALPVKNVFEWEADGFQHLVDSPLIASADLKKEEYQVGETSFHLWFQGDIHFNLSELKEIFKRFTTKQMDAFGDFPASSYHFIFQLLPFSHYHGVEHRFSTVITLGPSKDLSTKKFLDQLIGVSSHELYHFWNVCRIRPKELVPYDFSKEAYFESGIVAEGVTTYMGDLFLLTSGCLSMQEYLTKLQKSVNRELENFGWKNQSITESSFDLWLDGYKPGIPDRKVSIYIRGSLLSLCLDVLLLKNGSSLSEVMKWMWIQFGKNGIGYTLPDFQKLVGQAMKENPLVEEIFDQYIYGKNDLLPFLEEQLGSLGIRIEKWEGIILESRFGLKIDHNQTIIAIHPESPAYKNLMIGDVITQQKFSTVKDIQRLNLIISRHHRKIIFSLKNRGEIYYKDYRLVQYDFPDLFYLWIK
jgi:predicted metalloprotease with PDZ domain